MKRFLFIVSILLGTIEESVYIVMCIEPYITCTQAQKLDIEGNTAEAEKKAALAKKLNIVAYITTWIYISAWPFLIVGVVFLNNTT